MVYALNSLASTIAASRQSDDFGRNWHTVRACARRWAPSTQASVGDNIPDKVTWVVSLHAAALLAASGLATWAGVVGRGRRSVPGTLALAWMMFATAYWAVISALHTVVLAFDVRIALAQLQYIGIAAVAPLWLIFTSQYARRRWLEDRPLVALLWVLPIATVAIAFTNASHHLLWTEIRPVDGGLRLQYLHGPWFWVAVAYNYAALAAGTTVLIRSLRRFPLPYRRQTAFIVGASLVPWLANALYVLGLLPPGLDVTPIAFAVSGAMFVWGFYRHRLFGLVPIARDLVIDSIGDGVIVLDQQRMLVDLNPAAERITGCTQEAIGRPVDEVMPWWTQAASTEGGPTTGLPNVVTVNSLTLEVEVKPVRDGQNRFAGWLVLTRDISARRKAENEKRLLDRRVQEQQKLESLSVLAGGVAHDFNNLLTGILGNADLLSMSAAENPALRKSADAIVIGAQRAADLVSKILAYAGEGRAISELVDLDELIREMLDLLQASVARHCTLEYIGAGPLPRVRVDPTQLRQVVLNLIANASEAVDDEGRITVSGGSEKLTAVTLADMTFSTDATPGRFAYVEVKDNGPGMDAATMTRIFDPFFSTKQTGRGLGLAAVQGIVRSHKGALRVASAPGNGTTFKVWFPLEPEQVARAGM
jgi:signal transduction histidine kinase